MKFDIAISSIAERVSNMDDSQLARFVLGEPWLYSDEGIAFMGPVMLNAPPEEQPALKRLVGMMSFVKINVIKEEKL